MLLIPVEDSYRKQFDVDGRPCVLDILDTGGFYVLESMRRARRRGGVGYLALDGWSVELVEKRAQA